MTKPPTPEGRAREMYACLYIPELPTQALLRLRPALRNRACVVMEGESPLERVCSLNRWARVLGAAPGMTPVEIETFPAITVLPRSLPDEDAAAHALLECAGAFSPRIEDHSRGTAFTCVLDIAGTEKLFGPHPELAEILLQHANALGVTGSIAVSSNFHAAICLARGMLLRNRVRIIAPGEEQEALSALPLTALELPEEQAARFSSWGIRTFGMLANLPEVELIARLGQEGKMLRQMARGELSHLFLPIESAFKLEERMELDTPVEQLDSLLFVIGVLLEQLIVRAAARALALASLTITFTLEGAGSHTRAVQPALPSNDRQFWIKLLHLDLEAHPPQAAILALALRAEPGSSSKLQGGLFSPQLPEPEHLDVTMARLRAIVGEECVGRPVLEDTHRPDAFRIAPFQMPADEATEIVLSEPRTALRQLRPPERVPLTWSENTPKNFIFREKRYMVERAYGPWVASGGWWSERSWHVEQWDLVARAEDGSLLCCSLASGASQDDCLIIGLYD